MKCPYCGNEMIHGMIHIDSNGTFFEQSFGSDNDTPGKEKSQIMKRLLVGYAPADTNMKECSDAWCCESCKKVFGEFPLREEWEGQRAQKLKDQEEETNMTQLYLDLEKNVPVHVFPKAQKEVDR